MKKVYPDGVCSAVCVRDVLVVLGVTKNGAEPRRKRHKSGRRYPPEGWTIFFLPLGGLKKSSRRTRKNFPGAFFSSFLAVFLLFPSSCAQVCVCVCVFFVSFSFFHNGGCSTIGGFVCVLLSLSLTLVVMVFECCVDLFFLFSPMWVCWCELAWKG